MRISRDKIFVWNGPSSFRQMDCSPRFRRSSLRARPRSRKFPLLLPTSQPTRNDRPFRRARVGSQKRGRNRRLGLGVTPEPFHQLSGVGSSFSSNMRSASPIDATVPTKRDLLVLVRMNSDRNEWWSPSRTAGVFPRSFELLGWAMGIRGVVLVEIEIHTDGARPEIDGFAPLEVRRAIFSSSCCSCSRSEMTSDAIEREGMSGGE